MPHVHASAVDFLVMAAMFMILKAGVLLITTQWPDAPLSKALQVLS